MIDDLYISKDSRIDLVIIQSKRETSFSEDVIMKWKSVSKNLLDLNAQDDMYIDRYNNDVLEKFSLFRDLYIKNITKNPALKISYYYASYANKKDLHQNVIAQADELQKEIKSLYPSKKIEVKVEFWGERELIDVAQSHPEPNLRLPLMEQPISSEDNSYVALVNIAQYYKFICDDNNNLRRNIFEFNVHDYQGRNIVNRAIESTLKNSNSDDFWWLNNGITLLADEVNFASTKILVLKNPAIVNGLQTSTEIFKYFNENKNKVDEEKRNILVRVISPSDEESRDRIILATNNQTKVPQASLRVNDSIHWQIELFLKKHKLYYDRRKNYYKNQGKKSNEIVSVPFLAQCMITLLLTHPDYARARPSTLLSDDDIYEKLYNSEQNLEVFCNATLLGKKIDIFLKRSPKYIQTERHDMLFYVLYFAVAKKLNKEGFSSCDIKKLNIDEFDDVFLSGIATEVFEVYSELGGNGKVAKGTRLLSALIDRLHAQGA
ncbi:MAG: AIPR family protein [Desulfovibrio sp.]|nr:AIPR family protein [Desulfovibrio sp.]